VAAPVGSRRDDFDSLPVVFDLDGVAGAGAMCLAAHPIVGAVGQRGQAPDPLLGVVGPVDDLFRRRSAARRVRLTAASSRSSQGVAEVAVALLGGSNQRLDRSRLRLELRDRRGGVEGQELVPLGCTLGQVTAGGSQRLLDVQLAGPGLPHDLRRTTRAEQGQRLDGGEIALGPLPGPVLVLVLLEHGAGHVVGILLPR
jgi:hypothetical protein